CGHSVFQGNSGNLQGGGVYCYLYPGTNSSAAVDNTTFDSNVLNGMGGFGGGLRGQNETVTLLASTFSHNSCSDQGGGLWVWTGNPATITNCTFSNNHATSSTAGYGGGMCLEFGAATVTNTTFAENTAGEYAGGIFAPSSTSITLVNSLFWNNT